MEVDRCVLDAVIGEFVLDSLHDVSLDVESEVI